MLVVWSRAFGDRDPASLTTEDITTIAQRLRAEHNWKPATYTGSLNVLSRFYSWLEQRGVIDKNPERHIPRKKGYALRSLRTFVATPEQFQKLLTSLATEPHVYEAVVVAASTVLRFSKVAGLRRGDLHEDGEGSWYLTCWDKNGEQHAAPLYEPALEIISTNRRSRSSAPVRPSRGAGSCRDPVRTAEPEVRDYAPETGLPGERHPLQWAGLGFSFHSLRQYFASTLFNSGADIRTVHSAETGRASPSWSATRS